MLAFLASAALLLGGCSPDAQAPFDYAIVITSSHQSADATFGGSYQYTLDGQHVTRDLSGDGSHGLNFEADELLAVRVHAASQDGLHSLTIHRDGKLVFDSRAQSSQQPLIYHAQTRSRP